MKREKKILVEHNFWQQKKHAKQYSELLHSLKIEPLINLGFLLYPAAGEKKKKKRSGEEKETDFPTLIFKLKKNVFKSAKNVLQKSPFVLLTKVRSSPPSFTAVKDGPCLLILKKKKILAFETKCMRKLLRISYLEHKTNDRVRSMINFLVGPREPVLATVKRRKLARFGHVTPHDSLSKTILQGTLEGWRRRGRQRKCSMDSIKEWTSLSMPEMFTRASCRKDWKRISAESFLVSPRRHSR